MSVKLTKNEQKKQKDSLKQYERYLPTLQLKKQQLQSVIQQIYGEIAVLEKKQQAFSAGIESWIAVYAENGFLPDGAGLETLVAVDSVERSTGNIAGVPIPEFRGIKFRDIRYDLIRYPLWVDRAVRALKDIAEISAVIDTYRRQIELLSKELRSTSQRVNLFEKIKIPETRENIRVIGIYLGDQQTAAVVRGKIAKSKLLKEDRA